MGRPKSWRAAFVSVGFSFFESALEVVAAGRLRFAARGRFFEELLADGFFVDLDFPASAVVVFFVFFVLVLVLDAGADELVAEGCWGLSLLCTIT